MTRQGAVDQVELELWPRHHDLPPRWDGLPVTWGDWKDAGTVFICPPPKKADSCSRCGSTAPHRMACGRIQAEPATDLSVIGIITAFRCKDCDHDHVLDHAGNQWDLDPSDYTDEGSFEHLPTHPR